MEGKKERDAEFDMYMYINSQKNSYLGLWGRIFDGNAEVANGTIADRLKAGAEEAETRLLQRLKERTSALGDGVGKENAKPSVSAFSQLGMKLPETLSQGFETEVCMRLQNFWGGNEEPAGLIGGPQCEFAQEGTGILSGFDWGQKNTFTLDCAVDIPLAEAYASGGETMMERLRNAATGLSSNALEKNLLCTLNVISDTGFGKAVQGNISVGLGSPPIKAILLNSCER